MPPRRMNAATAETWKGSGGAVGARAGPGVWRFSKLGSSDEKIIKLVNEEEISAFIFILTLGIIIISSNIENGKYYSYYLD